MFGILLDRMPGFDKSLLKDCPDDPIKQLSWRESRAADILFGECLKLCDKLDTRAFGLKFFGNNSVNSGSGNVSAPKKIRIYSNTNTSTNNTTTGNPVKDGITRQIQTTMSSFLQDSYIVKQTNASDAKKRREAKKDVIIKK
jgi:hypothetical protein